MNAVLVFPGVLMRAVLLLVACVVIAPSANAQKPEPRYRAKPLSYWVDRLQKAETLKDQAEAARAIQAFGPDAVPAIPTLLELLDDRSPEFRNLVSGILCGLGPNAKSAVPELVKMLSEKRARDPLAVMEIFGFVGPEAKEAVPVLIKALEVPASRDVALEALLNIGPASKDAIPTLRRLALDLAATKEKNPKEAFFWHEFHKLGPDVVPLLVELLDKPSPEARSRGFRELTLLGPGAVKEAKPHLLVLLKHPEAELRRDAAITLWKIEKNVSVIPVLAGLLIEEDVDLARSAALTLGEIGPAANQALPALKAALEHPNTNVQNAAKWAIKQIEAVNPLKN